MKYGSITPVTLTAIVLLVGTFASANLVQNGSFESYTALPGAHYDIHFWSQPLGFVEPVTHSAGGWEASEGDVSLDLNEDDTGSIAQTFDTVPLQEYQVRFDMAGNWNGPPTIKSLRVSVAGMSIDYDFDTTGRSDSDMGWVNKTFNFTATGTSSTLRFDSLVSGFYGPALDNVIVVPEPSLLGTAVSVASMLALKARRRIQNG